MKIKLFSSSAIAVLLLAITSCVIHKDAVGILTQNYEVGSKTRTVIFTLKEAIKSSGGAHFSEAKFYAERIEGETDKFKYRVETHDGFIFSYDGKKYVQVNTNEKTAIYSDSEEYAQELASRFFSDIQKLLKNPKKLQEALESTSLFKYDGNMNVLGVNCNILYSETYIQENQLQIKEYRYISEEDFFLRKYEVAIYSGNMEVQRNIFQISDLEIDAEIAPSLFTQEIPGDYSAKEYEPPKPEPEIKLLEVGDSAPDFMLLMGDSAEFRLSDHLGKVVLLDFWGTWCPWCIVAMPKIQNIHDNLPEAIVLGVSCKESAEADPVGLMKEKGFKYPTLLNGDEIAKLYKVSGFPTIYVVGRDGKILYAQAGYYPQLDEAIIQIIKEHLKAEL